MDEFIQSELLFSSEHFEALVKDRLQQQGRVQLSSVAPHGIYILLKLKPLSWRLQAFCVYVNELLEIRNSRSLDEFDLLVAHISKLLFVFFNLDDTFNRDDLLFLFSELIKVSFDETKIPADATGTTLVKGGLKEAFKNDDYEKVKRFIDQTREALQTHVHFVSGIIGRASNGFVSFFALRIAKFADFKWVEVFATKVIPEIKVVQRNVMGAADAFNMPYLSRDEISKSFIGYIEKIIGSKIEDHFACYSFLGQSSCAGKSRLLSESLETESTALFIVNINCKPKDDLYGYPHSGFDAAIVDYFKNATSEEKMTDIIASLLWLVFKQAFAREDDGYYLKVDGLSKSLKDLGIDYKDIACPRVFDGPFFLEASQKLKVRRNDSIKKVILLIAFDEAGFLIDREFQLDVPAQEKNDGKKGETLKANPKPASPDTAQIKDGKAIDMALVTSVEDKSTAPTTDYTSSTFLNTFRLIRRVLSRFKETLWYIPFVFAGTNTRFANFIPSKWSNPSSRTGFGPNDERWNGVTLFDPYVLLVSFDVYAIQFNKMAGLKVNWKEYIESTNYLYHICNLGRPIWGALLSSGLKKKFGNAFIENPKSAPCIPVEHKEAFKVCLGSVYQQAVEKISYKKGAEKDIERIESAVAIMQVIAGAGWISGPLANSLVEKQMAVLLDYRYDTSQSRVTYPSEPILAITALKQLHADAASIINDLINSNDCIAGSVGQIGELVARIIFLLALDGIDRFRPILPLRSFLQNLIGDKFKELESKAKLGNTTLHSLINGFVSFSHFARVHKLCEEPLRNLGLLVNLNAALCTPPNHQGIDLVIPVVLENGSLGSINVQVKSLADKLGPADIRKIMANMALSELFTEKIPSLNLILNLCPYIEHTCDVQDPSYPLFDVYTICIQGISDDTPILKKEEFKETLHKLQHMLKINRFDVDFRDNKRNHLPLTMNLPVYGEHIWEDWSELEEKKPEKMEELRQEKEKLENRTKTNMEGDGKGKERMEVEQQNTEALGPSNKRSRRRN